MPLPTDVIVRRVAVDGSDPRAASHALLRTIVAELAGVDARSVRIAQRCPDCGGPHGRPVVMEPPAARGIGVSLAHAGDWHVAAAAPGARVGVDVERRASTAARFAAITALLPDAAADPQLAWTRIEAVLKADGRGLRVEPATVVLEPGADGPTASVPGSHRRYRVHEVPLGADAVVSVAIER